MLRVINDRGAWREGGGIHELQWAAYSCAYGKLLPTHLPICWEIIIFTVIGSDI